MALSRLIVVLHCGQSLVEEGRESINEFLIVSECVLVLRVQDVVHQLMAKGLLDLRLNPRVLVCGRL